MPGCQGTQHPRTQLLCALRLAVSTNQAAVFVLALSRDLRIVYDKEMQARLPHALICFEQALCVFADVHLGLDLHYCPAAIFEVDKEVGRVVPLVGKLQVKGLVLDKERSREKRCHQHEITLQR